MASGSTGTKIFMFALLIGVIGGILLIWQVRAGQMEVDFGQSVRAGEVEGFPMELRDKQWSERELSDVQVYRLDATYGKERALERTIHTRGDFTISNQQYSYQAMMTDADTGIKHVFGYRRRKPGGWRYVTMHPDSAMIHIEKQQQLLEKVKADGGWTDETLPDWAK